MLVIIASPAKGYKTLGDLIAAAKGEARRAELLDRGRRIGVAYRRRAAARERRLRGAAHPVQGRGRGRDRRDRGARRLQRAASRDDAAAIREGQARRARGQRAQARRACSRMCRPRSRPGLPASSVYPFYTGVYLPAKTPREIVDEAAAARSPRRCRPTAVKARLATLGVDPMPMTQAEFAKFIQRRRRGERRAGEGREDPDAVGRRARFA